MVLLPPRENGDRAALTAPRRAGWHRDAVFSFIFKAA